MDLFSVGASLLGGLLGSKGSKDSKPQTQVTTNEPWAGAQPYLLDLYKRASQMMGSPVPGAPVLGSPPELAASMPYAQYFPYATSTAFDPDQRTMQGLEMGLNYADNYLPGMIDAQYQSYYDMLNAPNVAANPYVNQMLGQQVGANTEAFGQNVGQYQQAFGRSLDDIGNALTREWLPSIESGASLANQYGGTRQGVAEGVAMGDATKALSRAVGEGMTGLSNYGTNAARALSSNLAGTQMGAYNTGMNAAQNAMQMAPQTAQLGMMPSQIYGQTGSQLDAFRQQQIDAEKQRWDYNQNAPIAQMRDAEQRALQNYNLQTGNQVQNYNLQRSQFQDQFLPIQTMSNALNGAPFNQTQTTTGASNPWAGALGGAMTGYQLGSQFGGWLGGSSMPAASPWMFGGTGSTIPGMGPYIY